VQTLRDSTNDLEAFLERLFAAKPQWGERDFYIAGESYGGSYVPALGAQLYRSKNSKLSKLVASTSSRGLGKVNIKGIMVGNGLMDQIVQRRGFYELGCTGAGAILNETQCTLIVESAPRCEKLEAACRESGFERAVCDMSDAYCQKHQWFLISQTPRYPYDIRINCTAEHWRCQAPPPSLVQWLDSAEIRHGLGVDDASGPVQPLNMRVNEDFVANGEVGFPSHPWVTELLEGGIKVLIYVGNKDWLCGAPGMRYFVDSLSWHGNVAFRAKPYLPVHGPCMAGPLEATNCGQNRRLWGYHKWFKNLSFMEIDEAGHMAPTDQPEVTLAMLNYWIAGFL
jgi:cathepsin A (carboxypeptidase C)